MAVIDRRPAVGLRVGAWSWIGIVGVALGVAGCEPTGVSPPSLPVKPVPIVAARAVGLGEMPVGEFVSLRFGLKLPLPDGKGWRIDDHGASWLVATHGASGSELVLKVWREEAMMNRGRCEERARFYLYYQHRVDPKVPIEDTVGALADLVRQG